MNGAETKWWTAPFFIIKFKRLNRYHIIDRPEKTLVRKPSMPIIRISKEDVEKARKSREEALKNDPEFRAAEEEREKEEKADTEEMEKEVK